MRELVEVLATVAAGLPQQHCGFYRSETVLGRSPKKSLSFGYINKQRVFTGTLTQLLAMIYWPYVSGFTEELFSICIIKTEAYIYQHLLQL